jgi:hypothetical protein
VKSRKDAADFSQHHSKRIRALMQLPRFTLNYLGNMGFGLSYPTGISVFIFNGTVEKEKNN